MNNYSCVICGQTVDKERAWVKCPRVKSTICMKHCFNGCDYMDETVSLPRCNYRREKEKTTLSYIGP